MIKYDHIQDPEQKLNCDVCKLSKINYVHIGTTFDTFLFCKDCLNNMVKELE
jgi:hypothetical protein